MEKINSKKCMDKVSDENANETIGNFNENVKKMLFTLVDFGIKSNMICENSVQFFYLDLEKYNSDDKSVKGGEVKCRVMKKEKNEGQKENEYLNYYWAEYKYGNEDYRLCMYYKDFDHGTGNIHINPGYVQLWKKNNGNEKPFSIYLSESSEGKRKCKKKEKYGYDGGQLYSEEGWIPIGAEQKESYTCSTYAIWREDIGEKIEDSNEIEKRAEEFWKCNWYGNDQGQPIEWMQSKYGNKFYGNLKEKIYSELPKGKQTKNGTGTYYLYQWDEGDGKYMYAFYKMIYVEGCGFFYIFDNKKHKYNTSKNDKGPNYYDDEQKKWIINYDEIN